jgi:argininosuccinate synthase
MTKKVILAYSGGLDTSVAVRWLKENHGLDVITLTASLDKSHDPIAVKEKALKVGASKAIVGDIIDEFVSSFVFPALKANAVYQNQYPLATALSRPLIARLLVATARKEGAQTVAHGCTGKGNDQVRFEVAINTLAPELKILAPAREWGMTRQQTIEYARKYDIPLPITLDSPYSIDENLWGRSIECGVLEDPWTEPPEDAFSWTIAPEKAPDKAEYIEIDFEKGLPLAINGNKMDGVSLIEQLNKLAGGHGIGRIDHIEDRLVGIKSREIYEAPAAVVLLKAHQALEAMTLSRQQLNFKDKVSAKYADLIYDGLWFSGLRQDLAAYVESSQRYASGTIRIKLFKGKAQVVGRKAKASLYHHGLATYDKGDQFDQASASGFIKLWGLQAITQGQAQPDIKEDNEGNIK